MSELPRRHGTYRLGVFGGMFDPPHVGHLAVVDAAHRACDLDRVLVVPSGAPPHRPAPRTPARARLRMAVRAWADLQHVAVSDAEVDRAEHGEPGWMVETLEDLAAEPSELGFTDLHLRLVLIVGADQLAAFTTWHRWEMILELAELAVITRPQQVDAERVEQALVRVRPRAMLGLHVVEMPAALVSSTQVRAAAAAGDRAAVERMVPATIVEDVLDSYD